MLTIALPKGALLDDSIRLLKSVGLDFSLFLDKANRQLQIADASGRAKGLLVRAQDVPVYVEYGQAQLVLWAMTCCEKNNRLLRTWPI